MGISLIPTFDGRWYNRVNAATALLSATLAIYWGVFEFVFSGPGNRSGLDLYLAVAAGVHALYGLTLYFVLETRYPRTASVISFLMFYIVGIYSVWITKDADAAYFTIMVIAGLLAGIYGWLIANLLNALVLAILLVFSTSTVSTGAGYSELQVAIYAVVSIMTLVIWTAMAGSEGRQTPHHGRSKRRSAGKEINFSTDVLINSIADGVAIIGSDGVIEEFNPSAQKISGWSAEEAVGLDHRSVLEFLDAQETAYSDRNDPVSQAISSGQPITNTQGKLQTRSKKHLEVDVIVSPIMDKDKVTAAVVIFRDVSKQRSEERQRAEFISTASHEMRTPVAAIEGYLALAMNEKVSKIDSTAKGYLEKAHASTQHLGQLFQDLLTAAKSEDGRLTNNPEPVELGQMLDELIEGMRFTAEKKGLLMESDFGGGNNAEAKAVDAMNMVRPVAFAYVDPERIREVITNLFDNAIKYTDEGKITIGMHAEERQVTISVSDTGAGIPKEDIPHLFQKFYRVDNSATRQIGGTGLGLFISRKIVELYNGRLWVESELGEGSTFHITLPRLTNERAQELMRMEAQKKGQPIQQVAAKPSAQAVSPSATVTTNAQGVAVRRVDATKNGKA